MPPPRLLDQIRTTAALRHLSPRTVEAYTHWIKRFILFHHKKHHLTMGAHEVHAFLAPTMISTHVLTKGGLAIRSPLDEP